jgi:hypothetical protein
MGGQLFAVIRRSKIKHGMVEEIAKRGMRPILLSAVILAGLVSGATAQLAVGPMAITNNVNGIPITVSATSWTNVNSVGNERTVDARIFVDLIDFQRKFANVLETFKPPADNCAKRGTHNQTSVVYVKSGSLWPVDDHLVMSIRGHVDVWSCIARSSKSEIAWKRKKIGFMKLKVPVLQTVKNMKKNKDGTQPFHGNLPIQLVKKDNANIGFKISEAEIKLEGEDTVVTNANLNLAKIDINLKAFSALQSAIDPAKLKAVLPNEFQKLNMTVVSTRFRSYGGHAIAEINLAAASP